MTRSIHAAYDHAIVTTFPATESPAESAHAIAQNDAKIDTKTRRYYIHNGTGIIAAFLTRNGTATEILRQDYMQFSDKARAVRDAIGV